MTHPDFRALCAAGVDSLDAATDPDDLSIRASQWIADARAALAAPEQVSYELLGVRVADCSQLLAIATELENHQ